MWRNGIEILGISELCAPPWLLVILGIGKWYKDVLQESETERYRIRGSMWQVHRSE
jgi:hypothetical protein